MATRYPLRNQPVGRTSVRRLSPTAVRNTGPIQHTATLAGTGDASTEAAGQGPHFVPTANISTAAMPTIPNVDAAEFQASGNVASIANDGMDSSLTSSESDDDDRRESSALSPVLDTSDNIMHENENIIPDALNIQMTHS
ncbi:hypothetical protein J132_00595 [Termitomyces sp. J132]|nr:hypothetical protein H2248_007226 [Termitomyces sp. 'cryptogamus']KNZ73206.1 hypothetical protein J132_00595 [Termitomyces sp. J132]